MTQSNTELLPCPFCGQQPRVEHQTIYCQCDKYNCTSIEGYLGVTTKEAVLRAQEDVIRIWNTRATPQSTQSDERKSLSVTELSDEDLKAIKDSQVPGEFKYLDAEVTQSDEERAKYVAEQAHLILNAFISIRAEERAKAQEEISELKADYLRRHHDAVNRGMELTVVKAKAQALAEALANALPVIEVEADVRVIVTMAKQALGEWEKQ